MTGLDPARHVIVEIATLITDDDLAIVAEGPDLVVHQPPERWPTWTSSCRDAHPSGSCPRSRRRRCRSRRPAQTLAFLREHIPEPGTVPLCGNSIGTDRRFLAAHLPEIEDYLHYRSVDVSTIKELVRRWYPAAGRAPPRWATTAPSTTSARASRSCASTARPLRAAPAAGTDGQVTWRGGHDAPPGAGARRDRDHRGRARRAADAAAGDCPAWAT